MTVLNRQMFRPMQTQPNTPVTPLSSLVRRQFGTPPEGEIIDDVVLTEKMFKDSQGIGDKIGTYGKKIGSGILNALKFNPMKDLIEKTDSIIGTLNKMVSEQGIDPNKAAEIINIITTERRKPNPNLELLNDFYTQIVIGNQGYEQGYEAWKEDETRAEEFMNTPVEVERQMGSPPMGEQVNANNVGIMDGFEGEQVQVAEQVMGQGSAAKDEIDKSDTYDELMQSIRGDDLSEHDRRQELASVVGEKDAYETPDSVLALVQPVMQMMDTETANTGVGQIEEGQQMANMTLPQRPVGIANGGYLRKIPGYAESDADGVTKDDTELSSDQWANLAQILGLGKPDLKTSYEERLPLYTELLGGKSPDVTAGETWGDVSQAAFAWGQGASPGEAMNFLSQSLIKRASASDKEKRAMDVQLKLAALKAAEGDVQLEKTLLNKIETKKLEQDAKDKKGTSYMKSKINETDYAEIPAAFGEIAGLTEMIETLPEGTNIHVDSKNKTTITLPKEADSEAYFDMGQNKVVWYTDGEYNALDDISKGNLTTVGEGTSWVKMRITKDPLEAGGDPVIEEIDVRLFDVDDYKDKGYIIIPNSQITIGEKEGLIMAEGGLVVKRASGTNESGEGDDLEVTVPIQYTEEEILEEFKSAQPVLKSEAAQDQAKKLVAAGDLALKNLVKLKNLILNDPTLAGAQGQIIESGRDVFQILNSIENSVLGDIIWKDEKEGGWVNWFDKPEIESISRLKSDIAAALGDLRYFKGARQPNWMVNLQATREADVTGLFGHEKALAKIDSMAVKLSDLLKYYTSLSGNTKEARQTQIDTLVKRIHNMQSPVDTTETSIEGMTIDQVKEMLPPEMLEAMDSDPDVMDAITVIMKGADVDLVIERFNELKQAE